MAICAVSFGVRGKAMSSSPSKPFLNQAGVSSNRVTSKHLGVGSAERVWANTKDIKAGKLVNRSSANTEMRAILCTSARIQEARIRQDLLEAATPSRASEMFSDDDIK